MERRTDLAVEARELAGEDISGVEFTRRKEDGFEISRLVVKNHQASVKLKKEKGTYITIDIPTLTDNMLSTDKRIQVVAKEISRLLPVNGLVLVCGLGNMDITPDALGPKTAGRILATRHITGELARSTGLDRLRPVAVLSTGVTGQTGIETFEYIESKKHTVHQMGFMDDLFFLVKTGRLSNFKAFFGTLVGVNAMADFNRKGLSEVIIKAKGKSTAVEMILRYMDETIIDPENQIIFVAHTQRDKYANILAEAIKQRFSPKEVIINQVGMACGASIGPGLCAAFYEGKEISENLAEEKKLMSQLEAELKNRKKLPKAQ